MRSNLIAKVADYFKTAGTLLNDDTEITVIKDNRQYRGKWFEDQIKDFEQEEIEYIGIHVAQNSCQILLK